VKDLEKILLGESKNFFLLAGPCAVESEAICMSTAKEIQLICKKLKIPFVFKSSYRKANRSRIDSFTGIGDKRALKILGKIKQELNVPIVTDIHAPEEAEMAAEFADVLQIPAFLCRQTALLVAAAKTGKVVNIKKGQFLSPEAMQFAVKKVKDSGNKKVWITERGTTFGYTDLVVDFRGIPAMKKIAPTILDITHSLQQPNQNSGVTGGRPELIATIGNAGIAAGVDGIFIETHPNPSKAKSDGANMLPLKKLEGILQQFVKIKKAIS